VISSAFQARKEIQECQDSMGQLVRQAVLEKKAKKVK
jgi:hypothetical protein